jgi:hypothetical protein
VAEGSAEACERSGVTGDEGQGVAGKSPAWWRARAEKLRAKRR